MVALRVRHTAVRRTTVRPTRPSGRTAWCRRWAVALQSGSNGSALGDGALFRRVLVPVRSVQTSTNALALAARFARSTGGALRIVHVRMWQPPLPRGMSSFALESSERALGILDQALTQVWACHVEASGVILDAFPSQVASVVMDEASRWNADAIVLTARARRLAILDPRGRVTRQVLRTASCPVLVSYPPRR